MKTLLLSAALAASALAALPAAAAPHPAGGHLAGLAAFPDLPGAPIERRGRGRGGDHAGDDRRGGGGQGGRPRVPGGSGCDDPRDVIEHPECRP